MPSPNLEMQVTDDTLPIIAYMLDKGSNFQNPNIDTKKLEVRRTLECRLSLDPFVAKVIQKLLSDHISKYETKFGKIPELGDVDVKPDEDTADSTKTNSDLYK